MGRGQKRAINKIVKINTRRNRRNSSFDAEQARVDLNAAVHEDQNFRTARDEFNGLALEEISATDLSEAEISSLSAAGAHLTNARISANSSAMNAVRDLHGLNRLRIRPDVMNSELSEMESAVRGVLMQLQENDFAEFTELIQVNTDLNTVIRNHYNDLACVVHSEGNTQRRNNNAEDAALPNAEDAALPNAEVCSRLDHALQSDNTASGFTSNATPNTELGTGGNDAGGDGEEAALTDPERDCEPMEETYQELMENFYLQIGGEVDEMTMAGIRSEECQIAAELDEIAMGSMQPTSEDLMTILSNLEVDNESVKDALQNFSAGGPPAPDRVPTGTDLPDGSTVGTGFGTLLRHCQNTQFLFAFVDGCQDLQDYLS